MDNKITIALGSDHAGFNLKQIVKQYLQKNNYIFQDFGTFSDDPADYPDFAHKVAGIVEEGNCKFGLIMCGSGNGVNMAVNKHQGIRSALCWKKELAYMARRHNDANICALPARFITDKEAIDIIHEFLETEFEGGRHLRRINKIPYKNDL
jgi:ribose 5-phosphate isomerase B